MSQSQSPRFNVSSLLSDPGGFAARLRDSERFALPAVFLALVSLVGAAVFGFAVGSFVDLQVAFADSAKMVGVVAFSFALTYPTMYVFASISGSTLSPARLFGLGLVATATLGCILAALAPVLWLFSVSTETVGFIVVFAALLAGIGAFFAISALARARQSGVVASTAGLSAWFVRCSLHSARRAIRPENASSSAISPALSRTSDNRSIWRRLGLTATRRICRGMAKE